MRHHAPPKLRRRAAEAAVVSAVSAFAIGGILGWWADLSLAYPVKAATIPLALAALAGSDLHRHPFDHMGPANVVTFTRAVTVGLIAAMVGEGAATAGGLWLLVPAAMVALAMDGLDGKIARSLGYESEYGGRLDMELDALLTLALSVLVWQTGRAPVWVVASGAMRYAFVAAAVFAPWLSAPLPPRYRRKVVCVVQLGSLILCLLPALGPPVTTAVAAVGLGALSGSFGADVRWLWRHR